MRERKSTLFGLAFLALLGLIVLVALLTHSGREPVESSPEQFAPPPPPGNPPWLATVVDGPEKSWSEMHRQVSAWPEGTRRHWEGWLPEGLEQRDPMPPWFGKALMVAGLLRIKNEAVVRRMEALSSQLGIDCFATAAVALALVQPDRSEVLLTPLFSHRDPSVRAIACDAAFLFDPAQLKPRLLLALEDQAPHVATAAMDSLAHFAPLPEAIPAILGLADESTNPSRIAALKLIAAWKTMEGIPALIKAARFGDRDLRQVAARGLARFDDPVSKQALIDLTQDRVEEIRSTAHQSLKARRDDSPSDTNIPKKQ